MIVTLWHIEISHYNEKVRWALDYKSIPHVRKVPMPGFHGFSALALTRGKQRRLPVIELDGKRIGDSTAIIAALERYRPDPPLYPDDPAGRARALELEDFFDEQLAPEIRRLVWHHTLDDTDAVIGAVFASGSPKRERLLRRIAPLARASTRMDYKVNEQNAVRARRKIFEAMDRVERELQPSGYLVGDRFGVADLTAASLFTPLLSAPGRQYQPPTLLPPLLEVREELEAREGGQWVKEMFARHRGTSAEVPAPAIAA
jgi:glutathione S-transferase